MSKALVNAVLKAQGLANIKLQTNYMGINSKTYKGWDGKMVKGIALSSHSPMDVTDAAYERIIAKTVKVKQALSEVVKAVEGRFIISETKKTITYLELYEQRLPTYSYCMNLDPGYTTTYLVPRYVKEDKK